MISCGSALTAQVAVKSETVPSSSAALASLWVDLGTPVPDPEGGTMPDTIADDDLPDLGPTPPIGEDGELDLIERHARDRLRAWVVGGEATAPRIDRFTLLKRLGAGGMGTVYAAYDEDLDRRVALKFLNPGKADNPDAQHRLLREAQALARLSHPNLVPVYEVGRFDGQVYLAMELIDGVTMRKWADRGPHTWQETLRAWLDVGRVLELVHAEGLVHRDIKPDNVIMGDDGRTRLVDFGLARVVGEPGSGVVDSHRTVRSSASSPSMSGSRLGESITRSHAVVGTPAYLAPEQRMGEPCGPAADQYSFCVALFEGLYDSRPHGPVEDGEFIPIPEGRGHVPAVLRRVLSRGLAFNPEERFASMAALVAALERPLGRARRLWMGAGGVLAMGGFAAIIATASGAAVAPPSPCVGVGTELVEVWSDADRRRLTESGRDGLARAVDAFAEQWGSARVEACEQTRVLGVRSLDTLDRRTACLDRLGDEFSGVVQSANPSDVGRGLGDLTAPEDCLLPGVAAGGAPPPPEWMEPQLEDIRQRLVGVVALAYGHEIQRARTEAHAALADAESLGFEPVIASALLTVGAVERLDARAKPARQALERAVDLAEANGDILLKEDALARLVTVAINLEFDREQAERAWHRNAATLRRLGDSESRSARLFAQFGFVQRLHGDKIGAEGSFRGAEALYAKQGARGVPARASVLRNLGGLVREQGRTEEAMALFAQARALEAATPESANLDWLQSSEPEIALAEGTTLMAAGKFVEARASLLRASALVSERFGERHPNFGYAQVALTQLAINEGRLDDARRHAIAADHAIRTSLGYEHPDRLIPLSALGAVAFEQGEIAQSVEAFQRAVDLAQSHDSVDAIVLALHRSNLAEALARDGQLDRANDLATRAYEVRRAMLSPGDIAQASSLRTLGEIALRQGRVDDALASLGTAFAVHQADPSYPAEFARTQAWLARAHHAAGNSARAREEATAALAKFGELGPSYEQDVAPLRRLLDR